MMFSKSYLWPFHKRKTAIFFFVGNGIGIASTIVAYVLLRSLGGI